MRAAGGTRSIMAGLVLALGIGSAVLPAQAQEAVSATGTPDAPAAPEMAAPEETAGCVPKPSQVLPLEFCVVEADWELQEPLPDHEYLYYSTDGLVGFASIPEAATIDRGLYRTQVLENAAVIADGDMDKVQIVEDGTVEWDGREWDRLSYTVETPDFTLFYANYFHIEAGYGSVQMAFWSLESDKAEAVERAAEVMSTVDMGS